MKTDVAKETSHGSISIIDTGIHLPKAKAVTGYAGIYMEM